MENIFFDTSIIIKECFNWEGIFSSFVKLQNEGKIFLYITDVIDKEIKSNIKKKISEEFPKIKYIKKIANLKEDNLIESSLKNYEAFKKKNLKVISSIDFNLYEETLKRYFEAQPPFDGKIQKKHEFPDAFNILTIKKWADKNKQKAIFLTSDIDCKSYIEENKNNLLYENDANILLDKINRQSDLYNKALELYEQNKELLLEDLKTNIENIEWHKYLIHYYSYRDYKYGAIDPDYEIIGLDIEENSFEITNENLLEVDEKSAYFNFSISYKIQAAFEEVDYSCATYDKEDDIYWGKKYNYADHKYLIELDNIEVEFDLENNSYEILTEFDELKPEIYFFENLDKEKIDENITY